jgi:hypothetical protein
MWHQHHNHHLKPLLQQKNCDIICEPSGWDKVPMRVIAAYVSLVVLWRLCRHVKIPCPQLATLKARSSLLSTVGNGSFKRQIYQTIYRCNCAVESIFGKVCDSNALVCRVV